MKRNQKRPFQIKQLSETEKELLRLAMETYYKCESDQRASLKVYQLLNSEHEREMICESVIKSEDISQSLAILVVVKRLDETCHGDGSGSCSCFPPFLTWPGILPCKKNLRIKVV